MNVLTKALRWIVQALMTVSIGVTIVWAFPNFVSFFAFSPRGIVFGPAALLMTIIYVNVFWRFGRSVLCALDGGHNSVSRPTAPTSSAPSIGIRARRIAPWAQGLFYLGMLALLLTSCLATAGFEPSNAYIWALRAHIATGIAAIGIFPLHFYCYVRSRRRRKTALMFALYPAFFTWSIMAPTPLIVMFFVNISILVYVMFSDYLNEGHPDNRPEDLLWCMTYYFVALTLISGIVPALGTEMRYVSFYRKLHPLLAFGAILFEAFRWQTCRLAVHRRIEPSERFIRQGAMTLVVVTIAGFVLFNQIRQRQLSVDYDDNTVKSVPLLRAENSTAPPIDPQRMAGSLECRECHVEAYDQWAVSVHAYTVRNVPFQRTARAIAEKHGEGVLTLCATCHDPGAALSVNPAQIIDPEYVATSEGVGCRSCHYMTVGKEKNGMYALSFPRSDRLSTDPAVRSRYIRSASLEHVANNMHPILLNGVSCFPCHSLESHRATGIQVPIDNVTSFLESSASSLYECQTCHMPHLQVDKAQYTTKDHRMFGSHYLLDLTAIETDAKQRERLKAFAEDSRLWLSSQLKTQEFPKGYIDEIFLKYRIDNVFRIARRVRGTYSIADNRSGHFQMRLTNSEVRKMADRRHVRLSFETKAPHIAHDFPSSLFANISRTWFNLVVKDVRGQVVYKEGSHEPGSSLIGRLEVFDDDTVIRPDQNLEYTKIINRRWILPDQSDQRDYEFELSDDAALPLTAEFSIQRMRYNPADREWLGLPDSPRFDPITLQAETFEIR